MAAHYLAIFNGRCTNLFYFRSHLMDMHVAIRQQSVRFPRHDPIEAVVKGVPDLVRHEANKRIKQQMQVCEANEFSQELIEELDDLSDQTQYTWFHPDFSKPFESQYHPAQEVDPAQADANEVMQALEKDRQKLLLFNNNSLDKVRGKYNIV